MKKGQGRGRRRFRLPNKPWMEGRSEKAGGAPCRVKKCGD